MLFIVGVIALVNVSRTEAFVFALHFTKLGWLVEDRVLRSFSRRGVFIDGVLELVC